MTDTRESSSYLADARLGEVIALIQVLAYDRNTSRSEEGLRVELKAKPESSASWIELGKSHPELFRVREELGKTSRVSLVSRYVSPHITENGKKIRAPLDVSIVNKLIEVAIEIHDRQKIRSERWLAVVPIVVAIIIAGATVAAAIFRSGTNVV
ncbi:hypothetical protein [Pseudomonas sp. R4-39-08]|uniref:hypothetical protein n=1 Tax=Pseudomonas sp. R4-39-08 TaxID=1173288 RepID=UPI000F5646BE|nr:hypothetical protein [Pseudomonas sp. R4-39-08]